MKNNLYTNQINKGITEIVLYLHGDKLYTKDYLKPIIENNFCFGVMCIESESKIRKCVEQEAELIFSKYGKMPDKVFLLTLCNLCVNIANTYLISNDIDNI